MNRRSANKENTSNTYVIPPVHSGSTSGFLLSWMWPQYLLRDAFRRQLYKIPKPPQSGFFQSKGAWVHNKALSGCLCTNPSVNLVFHLTLNHEQDPKTTSLGAGIRQTTVFCIMVSHLFTHIPHFSLQTEPVCTGGHGLMKATEPHDQIMHMQYWS